MGPSVAVSDGIVIGGAMVSVSVVVGVSEWLSYDTSVGGNVSGWDCELIAILEAASIVNRNVFPKTFF